MSAGIYYSMRYSHHPTTSPGWLGNQVCNRSLMNVRRSSPKMSKMESSTMASKMMINAYSTKLWPVRFDGKRDMVDGPSLHAQLGVIGSSGVSIAPGGAPAKVPCVRTEQTRPDVCRT